MQYALVNGEKKEASRGLIGVCQGCGHPMIPKCGPIKVPHWAHKSEARCDSWWEKETPWHRAWKELFPASWREVRQPDANGECHIADIRTEYGLVIECQYSSIGAAEMTAREKYYRSVGEMVWLVDGARYRAVQAKLVNSHAHWWQTPMQGFFTLPSPERYFPRAWVNCTVPVFFDFDGEAPEKPGPLWCLLPGRAEGRGVFALVRRNQFVELAQAQSELVASKQIVEFAAEGIRMAREAERRRVQPLPAWRIAADRQRRRGRF